MLGDADAGVDGLEALGHGVGLGSAEASVLSMDLPVGVGHAEVIRIDQDEMADSGAGKAFRCPRSDTSDADNEHGGLLEALESGVSVESGDPGEAFGGGHAASMERVIADLHSKNGPMFRMAITSEAR